MSLCTRRKSQLRRCPGCSFCLAGAAAHELSENASVEVLNHEAPTERFGEWPSFHDAEIYGLRLDSGHAR